MDQRPAASGHVRWTSRPILRRPIMLAAFEGWNDAGDAASTAVGYLRDRWGATVFADIDPEEYFDFTTTRPRVEFDRDFERQIIWPQNEFSCASVAALDRDVIILAGTEPQLRWRSFCNDVLGVAVELGVEMVVTLGALLAEVPHSRPVSVFGTAYDDKVVEDLGLSPSRYEGPTGIVGVMHMACKEADLQSASVWAAVPTYLPGSPSPKATLALVERTAVLLDIDVPLTELEIASAAYERQVDELVAEDEETSDYVDQLEQRYDDELELTETGDLVEQVERFLRDQKD
jgi:predicted ATP-grasp superfamily ATP-dependent carboligase